ncbi:hypothetical protein D8674_012031 [Pyrus ussuriensis x Pyrus communis]|uniref:Uncharacterized protein n=1 Tax=Pyrus ussuriensis x Pyrus communis TaxID=2448454 RepID=A0A5N5G0I7_9ROSA|nr:hypothetical protein D8674_012031 [Pyrus ussuriensis x Pyrus communis]
MEVGVYSSSGKEHLSLTPRRKSDQDFGSRYALLLKKADQGHKVITQSKATEVGGAHSVSAKANLSSNLRLRSQQEFNSRPAPQLNQKKIDREHKAINQSKVMDGGGAYSVGAKEHLSSNPRRRSQQGFDSKANQPKVVATNKLKPVWDCGSSLYDSFELDSFKRQLDSAMSCRTMSMPHLSDHRAPPPPPQPATITASSRKPSSNKLSRSIQKLLRSVFKPNTKPSNSNNSGVVFKVQDHQQANNKDGFYVVYDTTGALTTIPEVVPHEFDFGGLSPEIGAFVRRTGSERFTASSTANIGISCA